MTFKINKYLLIFILALLCIPLTLAITYINFKSTLNINIKGDELKTVFVKCGQREMLFNNIEANSNYQVKKIGYGKCFITLTTKNDQECIIQFYHSDGWNAESFHLDITENKFSAERKVNFIMQSYSEKIDLNSAPKCFMYLGGPE